MHIGIYSYILGTGTVLTYHTYNRSLLELWRIHIFYVGCVYNSLQLPRYDCMIFTMTAMERAENKVVQRLQSQFGIIKDYVLLLVDSKRPERSFRPFYSFLGW